MGDVIDLDVARAERQLRELQGAVPRPTEADCFGIDACTFKDWLDAKPPTLRERLQALGIPKPAERIEPLDPETLEFWRQGS